MKKKKLIIILSAAILFTAVFAVYCHFENTVIEVKNISVKDADIPAAFDSYKIVQISDLHNTEFGEGQSILIEKIRKESPDIIAVTGDLIDIRHTDIDTAMCFIDKAAEIAPVYYVTGNHEANTLSYIELKKRLLASDAVILENECVPLENDGETIYLVGLEDQLFFSELKSGYAPKLHTELEALTSDIDGFTILLSHRPELFGIYKECDISLSLCGHAHGGQFRLPFIGGVYAPDQGFFAEYTEGIYSENGCMMIVSRGLGNSRFPIRINNNPEIVTVTLHSAEK